MTSDLQYSELQNRIEFLEVQLAEHPDRPAYDSYSSIVRRSEPYVDLFKDADDAKKAAWGRASSAFSQCGRHKSQNRYPAPNKRLKLTGHLTLHHSMVPLGH